MGCQDDVHLRPLILILQKAFLEQEQFRKEGYCRCELALTDFEDIWWVGDYGKDGGFIAIHLINSLSTGGFKIQSAIKDKGSFAFEYTAHASVENPDTVPFELYISSTVSG